MFTVLYKWRIKPWMEAQFIEGWTAITRYYLTKGLSHGSRLHLGSDGLWYGYARWPSEDARDEAFADDFEHPERTLMREAIDESFSEVRLETIVDLIQK
ncbi:MAG: antibiotic biosynthesis monooxygenase [Pyrinomonadaceae bacterium]